MCSFNIHKQAVKKGVETTNPGNRPADFSRMFSDIQTKLIIHRALLMRRLVQDPFYRIMNVSTAARMWMLHHLPHLADLVSHRYEVNLKRFFEFMGRTEVLKFLRYKNAPNEIIMLWNSMYPPAQRRRTRVNYKRCAERKRTA